MSALLGPVGMRLREERMRLGLDQKDLAEKAGMSKNSLGAWELGRTPVNAMMLLIFQDLGMDIAYILTGRRSDGSLSFSAQHHLDMLSKLSLREQEAVFGLVATLAGNVITVDDLQSMSDRRAQLHEKVREFKGDGE